MNKGKAENALISKDEFHALVIDRDSLRKALDDRHADDLKAWKAIMRATGKERGIPDNKEVVAWHVAEMERLESGLAEQGKNACVLFDENASLRAKLDEIEHALTECGMPAQLGNPPEPWSARDRILGAYADYLNRHNEACKIDMENWSIRAKLDRAKEDFEEIKRLMSAEFKNEDVDAINHIDRARIIADRFIIDFSDISADAPAQQTQTSDEAVWRAARVAFLEVNSIMEGCDDKWESERRVRGQRWFDIARAVAKQ
jgi:hypothetical protein